MVKRMSNHYEWVADTFKELPTDAEFGDQGFFKEGTTVKKAIKLTEGWVKLEES